MKEIQLTKGKFAQVDDEDFEYLNQWKWYAYKMGQTYYAARKDRINKKQRTIKMHRIIMLVSDKFLVIDHINHNGLDNRKQNLRICTQTENLRNSRKHKNCSSKYKGVSIHNQKTLTGSTVKWCAFIYINNKQKYLGVFESEIEAAKVYNEMAKIHFGEFAELNAL